MGFYPTAAENNHYTLVRMIHDHGEKFPKRHGNWIKLQLNGSWFLEMDSWNKQIYLKQGLGDPKNKDLNHFNDACGFEGKNWLSLGCNFGGFTGESKSWQIYAMINRVTTYLNK